jgi:hypothetical protein
MPGASARTSYLQFGTNLQTDTDILPPTTAVAQQTWQVLDHFHPLVRVHLGFRAGDIGILPEYTPGAWDFTRLDAIFTALRAHHIRYYFDVRTAPPWMFDSTGHLPASTFGLFANYMADLVGWYNKGGFTDAQGQYHSSGHYGWISTWEIWNEPKSSGDIPVPLADPTAAVWMAASDYAQLYDVTVTAMRAVDPSIATGGPALNSWPDDSYLQTFIEDEHAPLNFLSFHFYAGNEPTEPDEQVITAINGPRFLLRLQHIRTWLAQYDPHQTIPIWVDESGLSENSTFPIDPRGAEPINYAVTADTFITAATNDVTMLSQFPVVGDAQLGLVDAKTAQLYRTYWLYLLLRAQFPPGSHILATQVQGTPRVTAFAALLPDEHAIQVLIVNDKAANTTVIGGVGIPISVAVRLQGAPSGQHIASSGTEWSFTAQTTLGAIPPAKNVNWATTQTITGYGAIILSIPVT